MKCEKCGGRMTVKETRSDIYITYRKRTCERCGRAIYTEEDVGEYAEHFFRLIKKEQYVAARMKER